MKKIIVAFALAILLVFSISCSQEEKPIDDNTNPTELIISEKNIELKIGDKYTLKVNDVEAEMLYYESSDLSIVSVSAEGELKAKKEGTAEITISLLNDETVFVKLTVTVVKQEEEPKIIDSLTINGGSELYVGSSITLIAVFDSTINVNLVCSRILAISVLHQNPC